LIFSTDFRKIPKYQISWNPSRGSQFFPCGWMEGKTDKRKNRKTEGWTERHEELNSRLSQFWKPA